MGEKLVIHNYGHGGGGITLSWGSSALAVREAPATADRRAAVVGAGIMGLTTARLLQDRGWAVTIYTKALPPHTTSNIAGGQWSPTSVFEESRATAAFQAQFKEAARLAHHAFQNLVGGGYGVRWIENYFLNSQHLPPGNNYYLRELPELFPSLAELTPDEHPFSSPFVYRFVTMLIEPSVFLRRTMSDIREAGGRFEIRDFRDRSEVLALDEPVIFNCTGLGAAALFGDTELTPVRGQLVFVPPDEPAGLPHGRRRRGCALHVPAAGWHSARRQLRARRFASDGRSGHDRPDPSRARAHRARDADLDDAGRDDRDRMRACQSKARARRSRAT